MSRRRPVVRTLSAAAVAREDAECRLHELSAELGTEELEVLVRLGARLLEGQRVYGLLDLANDDRDLEAERGDELADLLVYGAMAELRGVLRRRRAASHAALRQLAGRSRRRGGP